MPGQDKFNSLQISSLKNIWHPCSQMKHYEKFPLIPIKNAKGVWLYDEKGNKLLDGISSWWTNILGHSNIELNNAISKQIKSFQHVILSGFTHEPAVKLSESLKKKTKGNLSHLFFGSDGSSVVEIALKMSHHYWKASGKKNKKKFVCLKSSYHGETIGAMSVSDSQSFKKPYSLLYKKFYVTDNPDYRGSNNLSNESIDKVCLKKIEKLFKEKCDELSAIIIEPIVQGAAGMVMHSDYFLKEFYSLAFKYKVHVIADEIAVGFGRTGHFFASEKAKLWPDFLLLSKSITSGYLPLSVLMTKKNIYQCFYDDKVINGFLHSHTFSGSAIACSIANKVIEILDRDEFIKKNKITKKLIWNAFDWVKSNDAFCDLRQKGMILAFDVKKELIDDMFAKKLFYLGYENNVFVRPINNTIYFMPPYIINEDQINFYSEKLKLSLNKLLNK